ncbi:MAG: hypothetical protein WD403_10150 [Pirellulales bacterium]
MKCKKRILSDYMDAMIKIDKIEKATQKTRETSQKSPKGALRGLRLRPWRPVIGYRAGPGTHIAPEVWAVYGSNGPCREGGLQWQGRGASEGGLPV